MNNQDGRLLTRMPVLYDSVHEFPLQMEEEPMLPLLSTFASFTLSTLSSALTSPSSTSPTVTDEEIESTSPNSDQLDSSSPTNTEENSDGQKSPQSHDVVNEITKRFKHCMPQTPGESDLHRAAFSGDLEYLQSLLCDRDTTTTSRFRVDRINQKNRLGCTPIRLAATGGHVDCLSLLIEAGAAIDVVDVKCQTPLFVAVKNRRLECACRLLQCGAKPEGDPGNSSTPLYVAIMNGDVSYLLLLLQFGADPDKLRHSRVSLTINPSRFTSLNMVVDNFGGEDQVLLGVRALLKTGCSRENLDVSTVILNDYVRVLDFLYDFGVPLGSRDKICRVLAEFPRHNESKARLQHIAEHPRSLMSACRITILQHLPPGLPFDDLNSLPLPNALLSYITFQHD